MKKPHCLFVASTWPEVRLRRPFFRVRGVLKQDPRYWVKVLKQLSNFLKEKILVWDNKQEVVTTAKAFGFRAELFEDLEQYQTIMKRSYKL